jgi:NADH dehydrogenase FAD-containing subunit
MASVPQDDHIRADLREPIPSPKITSTNSTPSQNQRARPLRLAIVGGGIGGLCLALGLRKHSHIDLQIYEAAHKCSARSAPV